MADARRMVRFRLEAEDLAAFNLHRMQSAPRYRLMQLFWRIVPPLVVIGVWAYIVRSSADPQAAAERLWWFLLYVPIHFWLYPRRWTQKNKSLVANLAKECRQSPLLGKRKLTVTPEAIEETNPLGEIGAKWNEVMQLVRGAEHVFFFLSPKAAIILPRTAFEKAEEYDEFVAEAEGYFRKAIGKGNRA